MKYNSEELVTNVDDSSQCRCLLCGSIFRANKRTSVQRHYERIHKYVFNVERQSRGRQRKRRDRNAKRDPETANNNTPAPPPEKKFKPATNDHQFADRDDYMRTCVKHQAINNLPFAYWDSETTRQYQVPLEKTYNLSVTGRKMRDHTAVVRQCVAGRIHDKLAGKLLSLRLVLL